MRKTIYSCLLGITALMPAANAQRMYGVATSNWSGTSSLYLNPANVADSRHKFTIDLFSLNLGVDNDKATLASSKLFRSDSFGVNNLLKFKPDADKFNLTAPYLELRGPGFMWNFNKKMGIALTTRVRIYNQFQDFNRDLYSTIVDQSYRNVKGDYAVNSGKFNWTLHGWSEIGLTYGAVLVDKGQHMLKGGVTGRYLGGIGYVNMNAKSLNGNYYSSSDSLRINNTDVAFSSNFIKNENQLSSGLSGSDLADYFFGNKGGKGFGLDLGLVYEWRPDYASYKYDMDGVKGIDDNTVPRYKLRVSAAVTDIGSINYNKDNKTAYVRGTGSVIGSEVKEHTKDFQDFRNYMQAHGLAVDSANGSTKVKLPTAVQLSIDYNIGSNFYANIAYNGNIAGRFKPGNTYYDQVTLTPRYDTRVVSFGVPITYNFFTERMKLGAGIRVAGFFFGSDDMLAYFGSTKQTGANFYLGAGIPINHRKPRDSDKDGVSNKKDKCRYEKGAWETMGCPVTDKDGDGVPDAVDKCPDVAGSKTAMGCPDADMDSVADAQDRCPNEAGLITLGGCPDRDRDGIADKDDACPDAAGTVAMYGCPDTDGDGIADNVDACPDKPGTLANNGCPDTDNDGVTDDKDRCPTVPGTIANHGCPEVKAEVKKRLAFAATAIQFETGKAVIKKTSYKLLDEVVSILNEYQDYNMEIDGHTDNVGKPAKNLQLSKDRAAAVKAYFVSKGIADNRLETNGFGDTQPAANNKTAAGRAKNRRVAMDLKLRD